MNSLARAVHGMVVGRKSLGDVSGDLTAQERAALADMQPALSRPFEDPRVLVEAPTQAEWWASPKRLAEAPTQAEWWRSPRRLAEAPTQAEWWRSPQPQVSQTSSRV